jgi:similar to stage IV sporulation protein
MGNQEMIHWWQGYVVIQVSGNKLERLINRMMNKRLSAWNIIRSNENAAQISITLKDFFQLRTLLKETGCQVHIIDKIGLPFLLQKMKKRMGLAAGIVSFCLLFYVFSMMIWTVEIEGVSVPEKEYYIREELAKLDVKPGKFRFQVADREVLYQRIVKMMPEAAWVGFQFNGTTAQLKVVEKALPEQQKATNPRNLVAKKKAIIHDIFVEEGQPVVKPNQYVNAGDLLVSGVLGTEEERKIVSAKGIVLGEVWYESNITVPMTQKRSTLTGERKNQYFLNLGPLSLKVWGFGKIPFDQHTKNKDDYSFNIKEWKVPISWSKEQILETNNTEIQYTEEEAFQMGVKLSRENLYRKLEPEAQINEENVLRKSTENGKVYIKMHYTVIEEIASEQIIIQGD